MATGQLRRKKSSLAVRDVRVIQAIKGRDSPSDDDNEVLATHPGAEAAACQLNRKFVRSIKRQVTLVWERKKFRIDDKILLDWLAPAEQNIVSYESPSASFLHAAERSSSLILASGALIQADLLAEHRWAFASSSAILLERYSRGELEGALRQWKENFGIAFAPNGNVEFKYQLPTGESRKTEWHLKEGDNTSKESAARIYFDRAELADRAVVMILYVGPHPEERTHLLKPFLF